MSKMEYLVVNDKVIINDESGMRDPVDFTNNFKDREILGIVINYLQDQIERDKKDLESKQEERAWRIKEYKKNTLFATGASVVLPPVVSLLTGLQNQQVDTIFGEMNGAVGFSVSMIPALIVASQALVSYGLCLRPSKTSIRGKEEKIKYEVQLLENLSEALEQIKLDTNNDKLPEYRKNNKGIIDDTEVMKYIKDSIGLRYAFGSQFKKIMKLYHNCQLYDYLMDSGMDEQAVSEFMEFIENYENDINYNGKFVKGM